MRCRVALFTAVILAISLNAVFAQDSTPQASQRKVVRRVAPAYPELALRVNIFGTVKLAATVAPNGSVKSIEPLGGNPVLINAAQDAVRNWKFAPAARETQEVIELRFSPR